VGTACRGPPRRGGVSCECAVSGATQACASPSPSPPSAPASSLEPHLEALLASFRGGRQAARA